MGTHSIIFLLFASLYFFPSLALANDSQLQTYIVHVKQPDPQISSSQKLESWYRSFLPTEVANSESQTRMVYSYTSVVSGFAAKLTKTEVEAMKQIDGFMHAYPDQIYQLQTTHTPEFLGLQQEQGFWNESNFGKGIIIGVIDTGIWPEHPSFRDDGMPPPPSEWKGVCEDSGSEFNASNCNKKLIGARHFKRGRDGMKMNVHTVASPGDASPRDTLGHGTHTASTAAGRYVTNANELGSANGTASGIAPLAHLAIYKVCYSKGCAGSDILAAFDSAVKDGVHILSVSLGSLQEKFINDPVVIGAFGATEKGVFVSCAAGNFGAYGLSNEAPWLLTVGASTTDRSTTAVTKLGNGGQFNGQSLYQPKSFKSSLFPLVYPDIGFMEYTCYEAFKTDVKGKIVICSETGVNTNLMKGQTVLAAGGVGMILISSEKCGSVVLTEPHVLPASHVSYEDGQKIMAYVNSTKNPKAAIDFRGTIIESASVAPVMAWFSSRGPNSQSPGILKPDIIGPGVNVLAGWPLNLSPESPDDKRKVTFNVVSGTSMATPHLAGVAALLRSSHPDWSPAAIKSAIMTTADIVNKQGKPIVDHDLHPATLFATGAGHVNPSKANQPGLVYDIQHDDYIRYLCGLGYTDKQVGTITSRVVKCSNNTSISERELNYPSISVIFVKKGENTQTLTRTVTNVGEAHSTYKVKVEVPEGTDVTVKPSTLSFSKVNYKASYKVTLTRLNTNAAANFSQGYLKWVSSDSKHVVRSPIAVTYK